jgi:hypothetical protein
MVKRFAGAALFGIGTFFLVAGLALAFVVAPRVSRIPYDLERSTTQTEASNATFIQARAVGAEFQIDQGTGDLIATTEVIPDAAATAKLGGLSDQAVVWKVYQQAQRVDNREVVNAFEVRMALDRDSGAAVTWNGQCLANEPLQECAAGNVAFSGHLFKFPFGTEKRNYEYFDISLKRPNPLIYRGTEKINGLEVYRFDQVVDEQPLNTSESTLGLLTKRFAPESTSATVRYKVNRTIHVEPVTGTTVGYRERQVRTFVPSSGPSTVMFDATFVFSAKTQKELSDRASTGRSALMAIRWYLPIALVVLGLIAIIAGALLTLARSRTRATALPAPIRNQPVASAKD